MAVETSIKKPGDFAFFETSGPVIPTPSLCQNYCWNSPGVELQNYPSLNIERAIRSGLFTFDIT